MVDTLSTPERSERMRRIKATNTKPELLVRGLCRKYGFPGYRLHRRDLPGKPDIAYVSRKQAIFIHGCFWHAHDCRNGIRKPKSRLEYWLPKIERNVARDTKNIEELRSQGWRTLVIWECETKRIDSLTEKLLDFLSATG